MNKSEQVLAKEVVIREENAEDSDIPVQFNSKCILWGLSESRSIELRNGHEDR